jgi:cytochrome bd-type quinol oxidase subunit 1
MQNMDPTTLAVIAILVAAGSEVIALLPIRANSWVQLIVKMLKLAFPKR